MSASRRRAGRLKRPAVFHYIALSTYAMRPLRGPERAPEFGHELPLARGRFQATYYRCLDLSSNTIMRYYKGRWDEDRGDEFASWGMSDWYFEVAPDGTVVRQMEVYDGGVVLQYDQQHLDDRFGMLTDQLFDSEGTPVTPITQDAFELAWSTHAAANR
jgi:hypothetical protein